MFNFSTGVRSSSPAIPSQHLAISSQHLLGQARAYQAMGNLEEAKKSYSEAVNKAKTEHEKKPSDRQAKIAFDAIRNEFFTFLSGLQEPAAATNVREHNPTSPTPNQLLPINRNDADTHRPLSAQRAQDASIALSKGIKPNFVEGRSSLSELVLVQTITPTEEKSGLVDYLFEKALSTLSSLKVSNKPSLFLVYAHDNPAYGQAEASTSKYLIGKLSNIRGVNLYSDQTPMGQTYSSSAEESKEDGKLEDILTNQLCLLPARLRNDVKPVNKVVVCCSEVLGRYLEWSHYEDFYQELRAAYLKDCEQQGSSALREVVKKFSQEKPYKAGFHHVLTEMAFLQIRAEHWQDQHGIIPVSLTPNSYEPCLAHFIPATTVRMEDMPRLDAQTKAGEVYPNQSRHGVLFKLIERLLVSSDEAQTFLNKFWHGYSECISRLKDQSSTLGGLEFVKLVDRIFGEIEKALHSELALTVQQQHQQLKHQQEIELRTKKEPLAILGENIEEEYFAAWEESGEIQDGLAMYVALQATTPADKKTAFNLDEAVTAFLTQKNDAGQKNQVLLLRGEAGSGKSTFNRQLARRLWREYGAATASDETPIALYISLPTIDQPNKNLLGQYLSDKCGFSPEQIEALRQSQRFILILDGYDEIPAEHRNLYADGKLGKWQAKIIISSRPEYLTQGYQNNFQPRGYSRSLLEYEIAPFSEQAIETYIDQYVKHACPPWTVPDYQDALSHVPNVKELLGTPFLLKMALIVLPTLRDATLGLTRIKLYEQFLQTWFERSLARLDGISLTEAQKIAFYRLKEEGFIEHSQTFNTDFALAMSKAKTTVAAYSPIASRGILQDKRYEAFLSNQDEGKKLLRFSALLTRQQQQYRFIHKSIQDYLVARAVWEELENFPELGPSNRSVPLSWIEQVRVLWEALSPSVQMDAVTLLNTFNVVEDLAIQQFLVERVQQNGGLLKPLLAWIKASTSQDSVSIAAANAITILIKAGVQFNEADLKGVQIPGADLSFGVFDSAQLQGADLSQVNFRNSWLRHADLSAAKMAGVRFGEWAYLQEGSSVYSCAYSPNGKNCAVGLDNGKIRVYTTSNWEKTYTLEGHTSSVLSVVYSPSGSQIASGSSDNTVRLWDAQSGAAGHTLEGHTSSVISVVYSPSGSQIASGSHDRTVRLWDAHSGAAGHTLEGHTSSVNSVVYSPNGSQIASGSHDRTVRLWDAHSGAAGHTLEGHTSSVNSVVYSPNGSQIASGSHDRTVRLWDAHSGAAGHTLEGHTLSVISVVYSPSGSQIASGSSDETVRLWDAQSGAAGHTLKGHTGDVRSVVYSPSGSQIASGSDDKTVRLWDAHSGAAGHTSEGHTGDVNSVVYSPSGSQIASGSSDTTVRLWDAHSGAAGHTLEGHIPSVNRVVYSPSGSQIASGSSDNTVRLWDAHSGAAGRTLEGHTGTVWSVVYSPSGSQIASGSRDKTVRLWDAHSGAAGHTLEGHTGTVWSVVYSPSGSQIASGSSDNTVRLWDAHSGAAGHTLEGHTSSVNSVVYSPSGSQIASGSDDKTARLWDAHSGAAGHTLEGHTSSVNSVVYSPSGSQIASGSWDKTVRLWEVASGECLRVIQDFTGTVYSIAWKAMPEGSYLLTGGSDKLVRQWEVIEEVDGVHAHLRWMSPPDNKLMVKDTLLEGVVGLSDMNRALLKQRGANDGFVLSDLA
ncbi:NB-ARC domain protein [Mycoavidus cysteinexigens]|uniref:NB-ARC domain protein n=2 Tax=Mycoavidus cysteinexigens TaxID=1553431 RepID=A0A2Z6EXH0_9BURK|nr:NACHT domain-containing protein [Mycoavidus cysteinexigens]BBE10136.1 NB-ARC domain protein [Mycoavidus cysteinexigens]